MKPLLIIPPAPNHWAALEDLVGHKGEPWLRDIRTRCVDGVAGAEDAFAVVSDGGHFLAVSCINKRLDVGILGHVFTRPECRRRGYARRLMDTLLSWFEMTGGKWLYLGTTAELDESLYRKFDFEPLRRAVWAPYDRLTMLRRSAGVTGDPPTPNDPPPTVRELTRADWPRIVALLQYAPGPDPRVPLEESAVSAELFGLDLIDHRDQKKTLLLGAVSGARLLGMVSLAIDQPGERSYAIVVPHDSSIKALREEVQRRALERGYSHVDFPMDSIEKLPAWAAARPASSAPPDTPPNE